MGRPKIYLTPEEKTLAARRYWAKYYEKLATSSPPPLVLIEPILQESQHNQQESHTETAEYHKWQTELYVHHCVVLVCAKLRESQSSQTSHRPHRTTLSIHKQYPVQTVCLYPYWQYFTHLYEVLTVLVSQRTRGTNQANVRLSRHAEYCIEGSWVCWPIL